MLWQLSTPGDNPIGPAAMAGALAAIRSSQTARDSVTLFFGSHDKTVGLYCEATGPIKQKVIEELSASYPDLEMVAVSGQQWLPPADSTVYSSQLHLVGDVFPIAEIAEYDDKLTHDRNDPVAGLLNVVAGKSVEDWARIEMQIEPASSSRTLEARRIVDRYYGTSLSRQARRGQWFVSGVSSLSRRCRVASRCLAACFYPFVSQVRSPQSKAVYDKGDADRFTVRIQLHVASNKQATAQRRLNELASSFARFTANTDAEFVRITARKKNRGCLLTNKELALIWHPATVGVRAQRQQITGSRQLQPPPVLPVASECDGVALGDVSYRDHRTEVAMPLEDRRKHVYLPGKTGAGKSTLLENMIYQDMQQKRGVCVFDPHGALIDNLIQTIPKHRTNDIKLFDPADDNGNYNPLCCVDPTRRDLVASSFVSSMSKLFELGAGSTPRLLYILRNVVMALLEQTDADMTDIMRMLSNPGFRKNVLSRVSDDMTKMFWNEEFESWTDRYRQEALPAIQNKIGQLLSSPLLRNVFDGSKPSIDMREIMDKEQVLLINGSKGKLGEDNMSILMALLVGELEQTALARADVEEAERPDFYVYCDEFQNYAGTTSFQSLLSEARKYHVCMTLANQYLSQIDDDKILKAVFGNVGTICPMRLGREDAERVAREMSFEDPPELRAEDLIALPKYRAMVSLSLNGDPQRPFSMVTRPPVKQSTRHAKVATILKQNLLRKSATKK